MTTKDTVIAALIAHVIAECRAIDTDARYDEMLDDCYSLESVGGPFSNMSASSVLKEVDPTAYRCGKNDWIDSEEYTEIDGEYYDQREVETAREGFVDDLDSELTDLENERDDLADEKREREDDEDPDSEEIQRLAGEIEEKEQEIADKEAEIEAARSYTF